MTYNQVHYFQINHLAGIGITGINNILPMKHIIIAEWINRPHVLYVYQNRDNKCIPMGIFLLEALYRATN